MYKLCYFVPESHLEETKNALFEAGAGRVGDYDSCAWQVQGQGQFRPLEGSQPFLGQSGQLETVSEYRVELVCEDNLIRAAVAALKLAHPYEEPAYEVFHMEDL
ncbi:Nif3-like dinuclear metal center hexameric protein [Marinobacter confluentis]|uniref:NGG1p interacting factor NIF3 n=1 Tax=Marinobacter confluentis TaxID=1697557 RepID=A0A4Z1BLN8_9GAMM|nr:YqfO family protein [Marinobacter confluentis]TGN37983.1 NGG1p interacting factor NIF3 [Marinobacter confluentis]